MPRAPRPDVVEEGFAVPQGMRVAAIDIGSNSIHMVVAEVEADGRFRILDRAKENVRLGSRTLTAGKLSQEAMDGGVRTLAAFQTLADRHGATRIEAVATCAVREASNGGDFVQRVKHETGLRIEVIPGREEARLIYLGVAHALDLRHEPSLIVDAGGGSVELILTDGGAAVAMHSVKLGVIRLVEQYLDGDPPNPRSLKDLSEHIAEGLDPILQDMRHRGIRRVVGTSGTMLNLIALAGHRGGVSPEGYLDNFEVGADEITLLRRVLQKSDRRSRLQMKGLDAKRVDMIIPGAMLADHILRTVRAVRMVGCTWSLREGVLLDFIARHPRRIAEAETFENPRRRSVARLLRRFGDHQAHGEHTAELAGALFDQLHERLDLPPESREMLTHAALLHDIGHHISHKDHQHHSYYLIANCELLGFRREEIEIIALTARYHRKAAPKDLDPGFAQLGKVERRTVRGLCALLRVADALDRSHYGVVHAVDVVERSQEFRLVLQTQGDDAALEIWEARRRMPLLEQLLDKRIECEVAASTAAKRTGNAASR